MNKKESVPECPECPECPACGGKSKYDMEKWPPKQIGKKLIYYCICVKGHEFKKEIDLK